jgi:hypothetical protein
MTRPVAATRPDAATAASAPSAASRAVGAARRSAPVNREQEEPRMRLGGVEPRALARCALAPPFHIQARAHSVRPLPKGYLGGIVRWQSAGRRDCGQRAVGRAPLLLVRGLRQSLLWLVRQVQLVCA